MLFFINNKLIQYRSYKFFINKRILWIFYLILFLNVNSSDLKKNLTSLELKNVKKSIKKYSNIRCYYNMFTNIDLEPNLYINNYEITPFFDTILYFLYYLPYIFKKNLYYFYFFNFKKFFNLLNLFFFPNYIHKRVTVWFFIIYKKKKLKYKKRLRFFSNIFYKYSEIYQIDKSYFYFLMILTYMNLSYLYSYSYLIEYYSFIINNLFYMGFSNFFILKSSFIFSSCWYETNKRFFLNFYSNKKKDSDYYIQEKFITHYSSIKFVNALNLSKYHNLSYFIKIVISQHFRRMLITSDIINFLIFLKTYVRDFKFIFLNLKCPVNEIFLNPKKKIIFNLKKKNKEHTENDYVELQKSLSHKDIICDIFINYKFNLNLIEYMEKYKSYIKSFFDKLEEKLFDENWQRFLSNFINSLNIVSNLYLLDNVKKIFVRYYLDCNVIYILKKKMLPLKKKKAQSIQRRRYKKIIQSAKRRFWIF